MKFTAVLVALAVSVTPAFASLVVKHTIEGGLVKSEVTNTGDDAVTVVDHPQSVVSTHLKTDVFSFKSEDGKAPAFTGMIVRWDPSSARPVVIGAGETKTFEQDISDSYDFSKSGESTYTLAGADKFYSISDDGSFVPVDASVVPTSSKISGGQGARKRSHAPVYGSLGKRTVYVGCTNEQISLLLRAAYEAQRYILTCLDYIVRLVNSVNFIPRWKQWFGEYNPDRTAIVWGHFNRMVNDPTTDSRTLYDCTCLDNSLLAYVFSDQQYHIHLCAGFWRAPMTGHNSKAGTIVHELTHFDDNGGVKDYVYGQTNCHALAVSNPDAAVMNADNHAFFAENTPFMF